jgi:cytochrome P450
MATFQALALLATHPRQAELAVPEWSGLDPGSAHERPYLRACVLDAVRLWPTTPAILRDGAVGTDWAGGRLPAGTGFVILTPLLHRDDTTVPFADRFSPEAWLTGDVPEHAALLPFSTGPGRCPGRELVLLVASTAIAAIRGRHELRLRPGGVRLDPRRPLPGTINPFGLRFDVVD